MERTIQMVNYRLISLALTFLVRTGLRSGVSELQLPCFTAVRAEIALMSGGAFAVTHHPVSS
ncbi:hypothetical protein TUM9757_16870 [Escherichia coli]|nr:hypothetical protein TUM9757_16870 [Escherichia coli]